MREDTENLVRLQELELERAQLEQENRRLPAEVERAEKALSAARAQSSAASSALDREESQRNKLDKEAAAHRQKAERYRAQIDSVKTPAQAEAIEHELRFAATEIDRLENEEFASLERSEAQEAELAKARQQVELLAASLDTIRASTAARQKELTAEFADLQARRESVRSLIDAALLQRFDRLAASRGTAIAAADNQQCTGCRMGVRPQVWNQLREGELLSCDSCGRMLYWNPTMTAQAKAPQPELLPGQGQAIRKAGGAGA